MEQQNLICSKPSSEIVNEKFQVWLSTETMKKAVPTRVYFMVCLTNSTPFTLTGGGKIQQKGDCHS